MKKISKKEETISAEQAEMTLCEGALLFCKALLVVVFVKEGKVEIITGRQEGGQSGEIAAVIERGGIPAGILIVNLDHANGNVISLARFCSLENQPFGEHTSNFREWWVDFVISPLECYADDLEEEGSYLPCPDAMASTLATKYIGQ